MAINCLALITAAILAASPFIARWTILNQMLGLSQGPGIEGSYQWVVHLLGGFAAALAAHSLYVGRRRGMYFIVTGAIGLVTGYFHNNERFAILPAPNLILGGGEFVALVACSLLILLGLIQEFLIGTDHP